METVPCNICGQDNPAVLFTKWGHNIVECGNCGLVYVNPRSFNMEAEDYFRGAYLSTIEERGVLKPGIEHIYRQIVQNLSTYLKPGRLLDVGCAMGHFMVYARRHGWDVRGAECSTYAAAYGREESGLKIYPVCDLRDARLPENHFDACVLIEVAEHLPDPRVTFAEAFRVVKPGGALYVTTPNFASFRALLQRQDWVTIIPSGHLYYFTAKSLARLLKSVGFTGIVDLTSSADFEAELEASRVSGGVPLRDDELEILRRRVIQEDSARLGNGRGEGLVLWAVKPHQAQDGRIASLRNPKPLACLEGKLVRGPGTSPEEQKVYYVRQGRKHWVLSSQWLEGHGMRLADTLQISREELDSILTGSPLG